MKIKKILPLVLLAVGSVFLLSSCDALLDVIFGQNTITVYATAPITYYGFFPGYDSVSVNVIGPTSKSATAHYDGYDGLYMYWSIEVPGLADGSYSVQAIYHHPFGAHPNDYSLVYSVSLPASSGSTHNLALSFNF